MTKILNNCQVLAGIVLSSLGPMRLRLHTYIGKHQAESLPWEDMAAHLSAAMRGTSWNYDELIEHWDKLNELVYETEDDVLTFMHSTICDVFDALIDGTQSNDV